jgi:hypothetical protein
LTERTSVGLSNPLEGFHRLADEEHVNRLLSNIVKTQQIVEAFG